MSIFDRLKKGAVKNEEKKKPAAAKVEVAKKAESKTSLKTEAKTSTKTEKTSAKGEEEKTTPKAKVEYGESDAHRVLVHPVVSEKTSRLESEGQYVFEVMRGANKVEIKKAVERHYRVHVAKVNIVQVGGKIVTRGRVSGKRKDWTKAYVILKKGETLVY
jgi:large subunit ribosomal protein L23